MALPLSPEARVRILPFAAFMLVLALRGQLPEEGLVAGLPVATVSGLLYGLQAGLAALLLAWGWRHYSELRGPAARMAAGDWGLAVAVGLAVFGLWIGLNEPWMRLGEPSAGFRAHDAEGRLQWELIALRWAGAALVVPLMEELFWRGYLMRWIERADFLQVEVRTVGARAVLLSTGVFTLAHTEWLAAVLAGLAYALLYRQTGKLWTAVVAHAVTNGVLGLWVIQQGAWQYW